MLDLDALAARIIAFADKGLSLKDACADYSLTPDLALSLLARHYLNRKR